MTEQWCPPPIPPSPYYLERSTLRVRPGSAAVMDVALAALRGATSAFSVLRRPSPYKVVAYVHRTFVGFELVVRAFSGGGGGAGDVLELQCMHSHARVLFLEVYAEVGHALSAAGLLLTEPPPRVSGRLPELDLPPDLLGDPPSPEDFVPLITMATSASAGARREGVRCLAKLAAEGRAACLPAQAEEALRWVLSTSSDMETVQNASDALGWLGGAVHTLPACARPERSAC